MDEVFDWFKKFKALAEKSTRRKIKILHSDNHGEYTDKDFIDFCAKDGIRKEWKTPYNPEHNRVT